VFSLIESTPLWNSSGRTGTIAERFVTLLRRERGYFRESFAGDTPFSRCHSGLPHSVVILPKANDMPQLN
jgi:hypothetical protein